ncbi:peptidase S8 and S53 subtilisin kexin sedolisin (plasmid) [Haloterrigena turkmenica DSM 5511]|uniref:Peptidase S8 and S53 subtilisin kexin sedolisin n=1 Tax=Haloterrigena turkmenica (strain ATCC 51198 / DSM 5511 / JCM 9101 / NCIMB 13204 / VKM B-1734 / 4k) TaxID=543526 RepID=D2S3F9_HALTV|nr:S8 family serine peptidase [Haloterrigena turkmenica]ADB63906.1 peptidase S8 and S53 subtilisin kexin sedolisin [Haloterrigena turkmenica DSM 5511]
MFRRDFLTTAGATAGTLSTPAFVGPFDGRIGSSDTLTLAALDAENIKTFGDLNPSFVFFYSDDSARSSLQSWVDSSDDRVLKRDHPTVGMMTISMPWSEVGLKQYSAGVGDYDVGLERIDGGAQALEYVDTIDANMVMSRPEPLEELEGTGVASLDLGFREKVSMLAETGAWNPTPETAGLAFDEDAPEATLSESRAHVRADDTVLSGVDTSSLTVAVIDTGVNTGLNLDESRLHGESTGYAKDGDPTYSEEGTDAITDGDGHGTWVAHCIAGSNGFAPDATVLGLKVLGDDGSGDTKDIIAGIEKAIDVGADVACLSLGSPQWSESLAAALNDAREAGVFCAVAVGNDRYGTVWVASPADADGGFGVQACNVPESGDRDDTELAYFGNTGPDPGSTDLSGGDSEGAVPLLAAPGMSITIELPSGLSTLSGTSMAAPHVAGGAAVSRAAGYGVDETWSRLIKYAYPLPNAGATEAKHGLLDVQALLEGTEPADDPADVRTVEAAARDDFNESLSTVL